MLPLVEFRVLDHNAVGMGISLAQLMERAGKAVAQEILERWPEGKQVVILCGPGNNGGDGIVAARHLHAAGREPIVIFVGCENHSDIKTELSREMLGRLPGSVPCHYWPSSELEPAGTEALENAQVIVDAMLGSGLKGELRSPYKEAVKALELNKTPILSVDVPTGLATAPTVKPDATVTFAEAKVGMTPENSGDIREVDIGFPREARTRCGPGEAQLWPREDQKAHKGSHGKVVIVGGGPYTGAPILAGLAAYRSGADLVYLLCPERAAQAAMAYMPEFIVQPLDGEYITVGHLETIRQFTNLADVVVLGPGVGRNPETQDAIGRLITTIDRPLVIDADALYTLAGRTKLLTSRASMLRDYPDRCQMTLLTPHRGELKRLGLNLEKSVLMKYAKNNHVTLLAKGPVDIITDGEYLKENHVGNPRMAVGGTGDVLAGCLGALRARGLGGYEAARLSAYLVGAAGDLALEDLGRGFLPSEVADLIPIALELALQV